MPLTLTELQEIRRQRKARLSLDDTFYCRPRRRSLSIEECLNDYTQATAFKQKARSCYLCPLGKEHRDAYGSGG